jgi:FkbM family methyltransferase
MHVGEDTELFLAVSYDVIGIEANPTLVEAASNRFAAEIESGRLEIICTAIAEHRGRVPFAISDAHTAWGSLDPVMIDRNERLGGASYRYVEIDAVRFGDILERYGIPHYLKIDIEGADMACVRALRPFDGRPAFVSLETSATSNQARADDVFAEIAELWTLGYRRFRYKDQSGGVTEVPRDGVWGGPAWHSPATALVIAEALRARHQMVGYGGRWSRTVPARGYNLVRREVMKKPASWCDLHAALSEEPEL